MIKATMIVVILPTVTILDNWRPLFALHWLTCHYHLVVVNMMLTFKMNKVFNTYYRRLFSEWYRLLDLTKFRNF